MICKIKKQFNILRLYMTEEKFKMIGSVLSNLNRYKEALKNLEEGNDDGFCFRYYKSYYGSYIDLFSYISDEQKAQIIEQVKSYIEENTKQIEEEFKKL